jgi:hypothetical protein
MGAARKTPLANEPAEEHILRMAKPFRARLLDVTVTLQESTLWKWRVSEGDTEVAHGYAKTRETAQIDGDNALFMLLSIGAK